MDDIIGDEHDSLINTPKFERPYGDGVDHIPMIAKNYESCNEGIATNALMYRAGGLQ